MDRINIDGLKIYGYHGVHDFEKKEGQLFIIDAVLYTDLYTPGHSDDLNDTVSYSDAAKVIYANFTMEKYDLIEYAAEKCAEAVLTGFPKVKQVDIEVHKPDAPIDMNFDSVSVKISRKWHKVYLSVGSNMGDRRAHIDAAIAALNENKMIRTGKVSTMITTAPYGGVEQDDFLNGAIEMDTLLTPQELLKVLHDIEASEGRERLIHWGPRTLDLDILFYDDLILDSEELTIPHPDMANRSFVLEPMKEIAPHLVHPVERMSITRMYDELKQM